MVVVVVVVLDGLADPGVGVGVPEGGGLPVPVPGPPGCPGPPTGGEVVVVLPPPRTAVTRHTIGLPRSAERTVYALPVAPSTATPSTSHW